MNRVVEEFQNALAAKIGRIPTIRKVVGRAEYFLQDPIISHIQRGSHKFTYDYRNGLLISIDEGNVYFSLVHCPAITSHVKQAFHFPTLLNIIDQTKDLRKFHAFGWSSVRSQKDEWITNEDFGTFRKALIETNDLNPFGKDLFYGLDRRRHPNPKTRRGNLFSVALGSLDLIERPSVLIELILPLMNWCLPLTEHPGRVASLAAALKGEGHTQTCEFPLILDGPEKFYSDLCFGKIEGAHIRPHAKGGTANASNGLWLCAHHHKQSEGKLLGDRTNCKWHGKQSLV